MAAVRAVDLFCGAGGSSWGARLAGADIVAGFDANALAGSAFKRNFPTAQFYPGRLEDIRGPEAKALVGDIDLLLASPECTNHSPAKGAQPRCENSRETAFQVVRFARVWNPRWIVIENVVGMRRWPRYDELVDRLRRLGYCVRAQVLNAADFGVPQKRRRLFIVCDRESEPSTILPTRATPRMAGSVLRDAGEFATSVLRSERRAEATIERAERAISEIGTKQPFLLVYYGSDKAGGWQPLDIPLRTITTLDRFAYVKPGRKGHRMRMLQVPELKAGMGMPQRFAVRGTRRESIRMLGNGVCPPVMRRVVEALLPALSRQNDR